MPWKAYWESGGIDPRILDLGTRWRWVASFTPRSLYPQGKSPWYPLDRGLGGPQRQQWWITVNFHGKRLYFLYQLRVHPIATLFIICINIGKYATCLIPLNLTHSRCFPHSWLSYPTCSIQNNNTYPFQLSNTCPWNTYNPLEYYLATLS
jgi:hypothetical protein